MKRWPVMLATAGVLFAGQVQQAQAINKEWSAALGFVGGMLVANNYNGYRSCPPRQVYVRESCPPPVVVREYCPPPRPVVIERRVSSGHYEYETRQVWVDGQWNYEDIGCGRYRKVWCPGYYKNVQVRVWVPDCEEYADAYDR